MMVKVVEQKQPVFPFIDMTSRELANILLIGVGVGLGTWLLQLVVSKYVLSPILCHESGLPICSSVDSYANIVAVLFATTGGLVALVRQRAFRPLLVTLAALASLWGLYLI